MTKVAIWCRHQNDDIIAVGDNLPWCVPSDTKCFRDVTSEQNIVVGRKTYETLTSCILENRTIFVLTSDKDYEVSDKKNHKVVNDIRKFKDFEEDLYISGGSEVYKAFMTLSPKLMPEIIVDCVFCGDIDTSLKGEVINISETTEIMRKKYSKITPDYEKDNVLTSIWVKRGDFVEQTVLKRILGIITSK